MKSASTKSHSSRRRRRLIPYLILAAGLLFTLVVSFRLSQVAEVEDRALFQSLVQDIHANRDEDRQRALAAGYYRYLAKPVELQEFIATVVEAARANEEPN